MPFEAGAGLSDRGSVRRGRVFTLRLEPDVEKTLKARMSEQRSSLGFYSSRTGSLGAFIIWAALRGSAPAAAAPAPAPKVVPPGYVASRMRLSSMTVGSKPKKKPAAKPAKKKRSHHKKGGKR